MNMINFKIIINGLDIAEMSCSYAEGLSEYHDKGKLGLPERFDQEAEIRDKVETLTQWIREARHIVVHTGKCHFLKFKLPLQYNCPNVLLGTP